MTGVDAGFNLLDLMPKHTGNDNLRGIALAVLATFLFVLKCNDETHFTNLPSNNDPWFRYLFFGAYGSIGIRKDKKRAFSSLVPVLQVTRALLLSS